MSCSLNSFPLLRDSHYFSLPAMLAIKLCHSYFHLPGASQPLPTEGDSALWSVKQISAAVNAYLRRDPHPRQIQEKQLLKWEMLSVLASCTSPCCSFSLPGIVPRISQFSQGSSTSSSCSSSPLGVCTHGPRCLPRERSFSEPIFSTCCQTLRALLAAFLAQRARPKLKSTEII